MSWNFVGRLGELEALEAAWLAAGTDGVAPVIVVYGEPGIGKTRTVTELARVVRARGVEVLRGTCYEGGDAQPYGVWAEAVRGYAERLGADGLAAALGVEVRWLAPLLGDIALRGAGPEFYMTSTELTAARLNAVLGRFGQAVEYFERARATLEQRGQPVLRAIVDYDEALVRLAHRQPGAATLLAAASARFEELGIRERSRRAALLDVPDR